MAILRSIGIGVLLVSCKPDLGARISLVDQPRILATRVDPAEAAEKENVTLSILVVDPSGEIQNPIVDYAYCNARKPLSELEPVSPKCLVRNADYLIPLANGQGTMPDQACRLFGPQVPPPKPGEPFGRPTDPDPTGGYLQPVRVLAHGLIAVATARIACGISGASPDDIQDFNKRYKRNKNPEIQSFTIDGATIAPKSVHKLTVTWPACPDGDPAECGGAERYLLYDIQQQHNVVRRENMSVSWFATNGSMSFDRTGRAEDDPASDASVDFTAPEMSGIVHAWAVLRDDRGGVTWKSLDIDVR